MHLSSHTFIEELINIFFFSSKKKHDMTLLVETCFYRLHVKKNHVKNSTSLISSSTIISADSRIASQRAMAPYCFVK